MAKRGSSGVEVPGLGILKPPRKKKTAAPVDDRLRDSLGIVCQDLYGRHQALTVADAIVYRLGHRGVGWQGTQAECGRCGKTARITGSESNWKLGGAMATEPCSA